MPDQKMFCENCGQPFSTEARFCETCGQAVNLSPTFTPPSPPLGAPGVTLPNPSPPSPPETSNRPRGLFPWLIGGVAVIALAGMVGGYYWGLSRLTQTPAQQVATTVLQPPPSVDSPSPAKPEVKSPSLSPPPAVPSSGRTSDSTGSIKIITNIEQWNHPVKKVLLENNVVLYKVEFLNNDTYPVFYVKFPYDPWFAHNNYFFKPLYYETLKANGFWDYAFIDSSSDCRINIKWDKKTKTLIESLTP
jgi:hypothetical protein